MSGSESAETLEAWYGAQYVTATGICDAEGSARFKRFARTLPVEDPIHGYPISGRSRMTDFLSMKISFPLSPEGYTCLVMTARTGGDDAHYSYAYWRRGQEGKDPEYICNSPTFDSRDGEYRSRFVRYSAFASVMKLGSLFEPFEETVLALIGEGKLELTSTVFPEDRACQVKERADEIRLPIMAFVAILALDLGEFQWGTLMHHTSDKYTALLKTLTLSSPALAEYLKVFRPISGPIIQLARNGKYECDIRCGQKLVPIHLREAMQASDYNLAAWRELAIMRLASDLVLNFVSPSFPLYNQWTYLEGVDASLFENPAMAERYARGDVVDESVRSLREARRRLDASETPQEYHVREFDARVYESIEYAQSHLLMSPVVLVHTMEDVGYTLRSVGTYARHLPGQIPSIFNAFSDLDGVARYLFELVYGTHCLHTRLGVAHTDVHSNNMTLYRWGLPDLPFGNRERPKFRPFYDDPVVAYVAGPRGEADTYVFPASGISACLIDYSRCVLGPRFRPHLEKGRSEQYATNFYRDQVNRALRALHRYAPTFVEQHEATLKGAIIANFEAVFPVLCAVDFIAVGRNAGAVLREEGAAADDGKAFQPFEISRDGIDLAARLEKDAYELFVTGLRGIVDSSGRAPFPGEVLLEKVFGRWKFARWEKARLDSAQLVDAYNYGNRTAFSGDDYAKYPPWARLDQLERFLSKRKIAEQLGRGVSSFLDSLRIGARAEIIADQIRSEQERLDGSAVSTASSWL